MNLALKYRPKTFDEVVGQKATCVILQAMIAKGALDQVLLFTGPSGVGKTSMARIIAAQLNSEAAQDVHEGTHPAVLEIDAASSGSVAALRQLKKDLNYATAGHRVVVIDECHAVSDEGKTVLLNLLEFPPKNVTIILLTTEAHEIPKEVRHRCDTYEFKKASVVDLLEKLNSVVEKESISIDSDLLNLLAQRSEGSYREALMLLNQVWVGSITSIEQYSALHGEFDFGPALLNSALTGPISVLKKLETTLFHTTAEDIIDQTASTLKDLMLIKGGFTLDYSGEALNQRKELAAQVGTDKILKVFRIIWDLQTKLSGINQARALEMAFSLIGEAFAVVAYTESNVAPAASNAPLSLAQMRNLRS